MDKTENKIVARFGAKTTWITLWVLALICLAASLQALSLVKPKICLALCVTAFVLSVFGTLVGICAMKTKLAVKQDHVFCEKVFGRCYYLPLDSITGIKTGVFNSICVTSASFKIRCFFVKNRQEILEELKKSFEK